MLTTTTTDSGRSTLPSTTGVPTTKPETDTKATGKDVKVKVGVEEDTLENIRDRRARKSLANDTVSKSSADNAVATLANLLPSTAKLSTSDSPNTSRVGNKHLLLEKTKSARSLDKITLPAKNSTTATQGGTAPLNLGKVRKGKKAAEELRREKTSEMNERRSDEKTEEKKGKKAEYHTGEVTERKYQKNEKNMAGKTFEKTDEKREKKEKKAEEAKEKKTTEKQHKQNTAQDVESDDEAPDTDVNSEQPEKKTKNSFFSGLASAFSPKLSRSSRSSKKDVVNKSQNDPVLQKRDVKATSFLDWAECVQFKTPEHKFNFIAHYPEMVEWINLKSEGGFLKLPGISMNQDALLKQLEAMFYAQQIVTAQNAATLIEAVNNLTLFIASSGHVINLPEQEETKIKTGCTAIIAGDDAKTMYDAKTMLKNNADGLFKPALNEAEIIKLEAAVGKIETEQSNVAKAIQSALKHPISFEFRPGLLELSDQQ